MEINNFLFLSIKKKNIQQRVTHERPINLDARKFIALIDSAVKTDNLSSIEKFYDCQVYDKIMGKIKSSIL
jgi:hypothetical protein